MDNIRRLYNNSKFVIRKPLLLIRLIRNYFELIFLRKKVLRAFEIAVTYACQCKCKHCSMVRFFDPKRRRLTLDEMKKVVDDCLDLGAIYFNISGGEPLLSNDTYELIKYVNSKRVVTSIATNGLLFNDQNAARLKKAGLDIALISLDALSEKKHDAFRNLEGCFKMAMNAINAAKKYNIMVFLSTCITHENIQTGEIFKIVEFAKKNNLIVLLNFPSVIGNWSENNHILLTKEDWLVVNKLMQKDFVRGCESSSYLSMGCSSGSEKIYFSCHGDVLPCAFVHYSFGNVLDERIDKIWRRMHKIKYFNKINPRCLPAKNKGYIDSFMKPLNKSQRLPLDIRKLMKK